MEDRIYISYNNIHQLCQASIDRIIDFEPDVIVAVGWGGFIPARIIKTMLKGTKCSKARMVAIVLSLYEELPNKLSNDEDGAVETPNSRVHRLQWIDYTQFDGGLVGKRVLIIDEVDDTRMTLHYAFNELQEDLASQSSGTNSESRQDTVFGIFVLHSKNKTKRGKLPQDLLEDPKRFIVGREVPDKWISYPWEVVDIAAHTQKAVEQGYDLFL